MSRGHLEQRLLVLVTLSLVAFGLVMVYSATSAAAAIGNGDPITYLKKHAIYALAGVVLLVVGARLDYHRLRALSPALVIAALAACAAVLVLGPAINGARRWFLLGPVSLQPSELAKLAVVVWAAAYLARRRPPQTLSELAKPIGLVLGAFALLLLLQPDLGTTISLCLGLAGILVVSGVPGRTLGAGSSRTGVSGCSASSIRGRTRRARAFRTCRRSSAWAPAASPARGSAAASRRSSTCPRRTPT
jgi:cell division protein FtsW (lipid II flippase)